MKKIYSLALLMMLAVGAFAQRDISVAITNPTNGQTIQTQTPFNLNLVVTLVSGNIVAADTVLYTFNGSNFFGRTSMTKNQGDTIQFQRQLQLDSTNTSGPKNLCVLAVIVNGGIEPDPDTTNNTNCVSLNVQNVGIGNGPVATAAQISKTLSIAPNPANNVISFDFAAISNDKVQARVVDITGRTVLVQEFAAYTGKNDFKLDISGLTSGVYMVELSQNGQSSKGKLIKQ